MSNYTRHRNDFIPRTVTLFIFLILLTVGLTSCATKFPENPVNCKAAHYPFLLAGDGWFTGLAFPTFSLQTPGYTIKLIFSQHWQLSLVECLFSKQIWS
jgi:hypothetical protein